MMRNNFNFNGVFAFLLLGGLLLLASCSTRFMVVKSPDHLPPNRQLNEAVRVALVLGGGAFHGMAHVGVIKVLEDAGVPIDLIVGTSAGSFVGALYAGCPHIDSLLPLVGSTTAHNVFDFSLFRSSEGFVSGKRLQKFLLNHIRYAQIQDMPVPYIAVTTDIVRGETVALSMGPVAPAVNASCAIPGVFEPVVMYGTTFVDGGVLDNVATDIAKKYDPDIIIAVDVMAGFLNDFHMNNFFEVFERAYFIASHKLKEEKLKLADILIAPDLTGMPVMNSRDHEQMYQAGIKAAQKMLPQIMALMEQKGIRK